ncbi:MAG TPA: glycosyltransferase family 2 protein [Verrucomicrobiae bacterium]|nr:glycosyltransferase family 2 protein [Verrucomicrobiae bacterium]
MTQTTAIDTASPEKLSAKSFRYVLVTPARNEAAFIEQTIKSVIAQTILPSKWVIVSDGSTDGTDEIITRYAAEYPWIELVRTPERKERDFGGKVRAFNAGYARLQGIEYDIVGNLDADGSFEADYIEYLLTQFVENNRLGVAGTNYWESTWEKALKHDYRFANSDDVSGLCQLFRRECFQAIGGYTPSKHGGVDLVASLKARMHGWETRTFTGKFAIHHRQQGTADSHKFMVEYYNGRKDFMFGGHPIWEVCRAAYRLTRKPYVIGGCFVLAGYFSAMIAGMEKTVTPDIVRFRRKEQMGRLRQFLRKLLP